MSILRIQFDVSAPENREAPVAVEVFDQLMQRVWSGSLSLSERHELDVPAGHYTVRAYMPSGEIVVAQAEVQSGTIAPQDVVLFPESVSPRESLAWAYVLKGAARADPEVRVLGEIDGVIAPWVCLWERTLNGDWIPRPLSPGVLDQTIRQQDARALGALRLRLSDGQHWLQVGAANAPTKFIALPPSDVHETRVLLLQEERPDRDNDMLNVLVDSGDSEAEAMLGYLSIGAFDAARRAERLLQRKRDNPVGAAIGGYYLLRAGDTRRLDWTSNLANWFPWLPDGAVIHAWLLLRQHEPDQDVARERLLEAARRGIPIYTQGLRLLYDGLSVYYSRGMDTDSEVREALGRVGSYAAAADWEAQTTTFYAHHPTEPDPSPTFDAPDPNLPVVRLDG